MFPVDQHAFEWTMSKWQRVLHLKRIWYDERKTMFIRVQIELLLVSPFIVSPAFLLLPLEFLCFAVPSLTCLHMHIAIRIIYRLKTASNRVHENPMTPPLESKHHTSVLMCALEPPIQPFRAFKQHIWSLFSLRNWSLISFAQPSSGAIAMTFAWLGTSCSDGEGAPLPSGQRKTLIRVRIGFFQ